ncbi:unnamed protein product [Dovyalis caffra]|uniref:Uncharacterized protein n=1 Tax=Dovyalis caffra TaxID=77055 RepID=A0AAV1RAD2_9ROSI|nr:unnamed protein product [Dovyalis caffra]
MATGVIEKGPVVWLEPCCSVESVVDPHEHIQLNLRELKGPVGSRLNIYIAASLAASVMPNSLYKP